MNTYYKNSPEIDSETPHQYEAQPHTGGGVPRLVTRGETNLDISHTDWLAFTHKGHGNRVEHLKFQQILSSIFRIPADCWEGTKSGWNGYKHRVNLGNYGLLV